jgi:hypothetical protein
MFMLVYLATGPHTKTVMRLLMKNARMYASNADLYHQGYDYTSFTGKAAHMCQFFRVFG